jgi:hypothetical protein
MINADLNTAVGRAYIYEKDINDNFNLQQIITGQSFNPNSITIEDYPTIRKSYYYKGFLYIQKFNDLDVYEFNATSGMYEVVTTHIGFGNYLARILAPNIIYSFRNTGAPVGVYTFNETDVNYIDGVGGVDFENITPDTNYGFDSINLGRNDVYQLIVNGALSWDAATSTLTIKANKTQVNQSLANLNVKTTTNGFLEPYDGEIRLQYDLTTPTNDTAQRFQRIYRVE